MKFGKVDHPETIDYVLPPDHPDTGKVLAQIPDRPLEVYVGCAKWNKQDLKNFYPRGTRDELQYYATQFNSIELNATFYRIFPADQYDAWYDKVPDDFRFFPKIVQNVSHLRRLNDQAFEVLDSYLDATAHLQEKLGTVFLQMHNNFGPKNWDRVVRFVEKWPKGFRLAIEFRHADWFQDEKVAQELNDLLAAHQIAHILVDTAGRRDMLHMRLTNDEAFVRYVGANIDKDYDRLDDWVERLADWKMGGLRKIHFFIHQNLELASPLLAAHFISKLNKKIGCNLHIPKTLGGEDQRLF